jgi:hypothetical protein
MSHAQSAVREASEVETAKDEANTVREISGRDVSKEKIIISSTENEQTSIDWFSLTTLRSLYLVYYQSQHQILALTERSLDVTDLSRDSTDQLRLMVTACFLKTQRRFIFCIQGSIQGCDRLSFIV